MPQPDPARRDLSGHPTSLGRESSTSAARGSRRRRPRQARGLPARSGRRRSSRLFAEVMLSWEIRSYRQASRHPGPVFFDRGIPDLVGYYLLLGQPVPAHLTAAAQLFRYHQRVFIAPPWPQIYTTDSERHQGVVGSNPAVPTGKSPDQRKR
ncbi:AAA family ATPase [Micromonospora orduensis]|nr:AAA family ATPase [Micromonospora orduensis]